MTRLRINACDSCIHVIRRAHGSRVWCEAFPYETGVPPEIINGKNDHTQPVDGDGGIHWDLRPGSEPLHESYLIRRQQEGWP